MLEGGYGHSVFVNCPFDVEYRPVLEAILFCIIDCDLTPRIASERLDSGEVRLDKIVELISECRYSIHDLSRVQAGQAGEYARLNMPFELGIDYGFALSGEPFADKRLLVVANDRFAYQVALSDIAGWDIRSHGGNYQTAMAQVRAWLNSHGLADRSPSKIIGDYVGFQEWDYERLLSAGWIDEDIKNRTTPELFNAMNGWVEAGRPPTF